jgi:hypothetical protein
MGHEAFDGTPMWPVRSFSRKRVSLQVIIVVLTGQRHVAGLLHLLAVLLEEFLVNLSGGRSKSGSSDEFLGTPMLDTIQDYILEGVRTRAGFPPSFRASHRKGFSKL